MSVFYRRLPNGSILVAAGAGLTTDDPRWTESPDQIDQPLKPERVAGECRCEHGHWHVHAPDCLVRQLAVIERWAEMIEAES